MSQTQNEELSIAKESGELYESSYKNLCELLENENLPDWVSLSLEELIAGKKWEELNNRFYANLAFGTGGMRGRTIGTMTTKAERGKRAARGKPRNMQRSEAIR